ncbi:uncharacterized protein DUF4244 [Streptomyces sp. BK239]|nr:uncharacterized protein DUF4244 [Streptomyces sp. BK239]
MGHDKRVTDYGQRHDCTGAEAGLGEGVERAGAAVADPAQGGEQSHATRLDDSSTTARHSKRTTGTSLTGVEMSKAVRARFRALVRRTRAVRRDEGMVTSEYAMGIVAAVAFAVILYQVITSGTVTEELQAIVKRALSAQT